MHSMNLSKVKNGWLILKVDLRKAFDSISWDYLEKILHLFNLPQTYLNITLSCIKNVTYTPLINGKKRPSFSPSQAIKQADPLFTLHFFLAMESLTNIINNKIAQKKWIPFKFRNNSTLISHLLFADDIFLFIKATSECINSIYKTLSSFSNLTSLNINLDKSKAWLSKTASPQAINLVKNVLRIKFLQTRVDI